MTFLFALFIPVCVGFLFLQMIKPDKPVLQISMNWIISLPIGLGIISSLIFWSYYFANDQGFNLALSLAILFILFSITLNFENLKKSFHEKALKKKLKKKDWFYFLTLAACVFSVYCFLIYWNYFWLLTEKNPFGGWDGSFFWNLKARFYYRNPLEWQAMFSPIVKEWAHPDYPILIPGSVAWGWFALQKELIIWPAIISFIYPASLCLLVFWYLNEKTSCLVAALGTAYLTSIYMFHFWSSTQYADIPLSFYLLCAFIFYSTGFEKKSLPAFFLCGTCLGMSIWTKDEGYFFTLLIFGISFLLFLNKSLTVSFKVRMLIAIGIGCFLFGVASFIVKNQLGTTGGQFVGSGRGLDDYFYLLFGSKERTLFIIKAFGLFLFDLKNWNGLWILFFLAILCNGKDLLHQYRWILPLLVIGQLLGYFMVMHLTKYDLQFQIQSALMRLISHVSPLALIYTFESFGRIFNEVLNKKPIRT
jgi:hypothetical protein